ncbi:MAG: hypothetical protein ACKOA9_09885 [Actinomycetota bacterium]
MPEPALPSCAPMRIGLSSFGVEARAQWRVDEEIWSAAAAQRWAHARRIDDVVREYAARGDHVIVNVAQRTFAGVVVSVGEDRIDVLTGSRTVSVHTLMGAAPGGMPAPLTIRRARRARSGGRRLPSAAVSFRARLLELEDPARSARLGVFWSGVEYVGPIVVGDDHVMVGEDADVVVPSGWVAYVAAEPDDGT